MNHILKSFIISFLYLQTSYIFSADNQNENSQDKYAHTSAHLKLSKLFACPETNKIQVIGDAIYAYKNWKSLQYHIPTQTKTSIQYEMCPFNLFSLSSLFLAVGFTVLGAECGGNIQMQIKLFDMHEDGKKTTLPLIYDWVHASALNGNQLMVRVSDKKQGKLLHFNVDTENRKLKLITQTECEGFERDYFVGNKMFFIQDDSFLTVEPDGSIVKRHVTAQPFETIVPSPDWQNVQLLVDESANMIIVGKSKSIDIYDYKNKKLISSCPVSNVVSDIVYHPETKIIAITQGRHSGNYSETDEIKFFDIRNNKTKPLEILYHRNATSGSMAFSTFAPVLYFCGDETVYQFPLSNIHSHAQ